MLPAFPSLFKDRPPPAIPADGPAALTFHPADTIRLGTAAVAVGVPGFNLLRLLARRPRPVPLHTAARVAWGTARGFTVPRLRERFRELAAHVNHCLAGIGSPQAVAVAGDFVTLA